MAENNKIKKISKTKIVFVIVLGLVVIALLLKFVGISEFLVIIKKVNILFLFLAYLILFMSFILRNLRWKTILKLAGVKITFFRLFSYLLGGWFVSSVIPARAGDLLRIQLLKTDRGVKRRLGISTIFVERSLDILFLVLSTFILSYFVLEKKYFTFLSKLSIGLFALIVLFGILFVKSDKIKERILHLFRFKFYQKTILVIFNIISNIKYISRYKLHFIYLSVLTVIIWSSDILITYLILISLGANLPLLFIAFTVIFTILINSVPFTPGGIGQVEVSETYLFYLFGLTKELAATTVLLVRFISYWSFMLISGIVFYFLGMPRLLNRIKPKKQKQ